MNIEETRQLLSQQKKEYEESLRIDRRKAKRKLQIEQEFIQNKVIHVHICVLFFYYFLSIYYFFTRNEKNNVPGK